MWQLPDALREIGDPGDDRIVLELIDSFQSDTARRLQRLRIALARRDAARLRAEAHSVHGSARQMGADSLADVCQAVEAGAPRMDWPELESQVKQTELHFAEACSAMSEYVNSRQRGSG